MSIFKKNNYFNFEPWVWVGTHTHISLWGGGGGGGGIVHISVE